MTLSPVHLEAIVLVGTFALVLTILAVALFRREAPAVGGAPCRPSDGPGPSCTDGPPAVGRASERDGSGPLIHPAGLRRRTPLRRTRIKRGKPKLKRTQMKAVSDRRKERDKSYPSSRTAIYERAEGLCEARVAGVCEHHGWQVHHLAGRGGPDPHRLENLLLVCGPCHDWIGANPAKAYDAGLMVRRNTGGVA